MGQLLTSIYKIVGLAMMLNSFAWAGLTPEQMVARDKGLLFYNLMDSYRARPFLEIAAEAGDSEAQYSLAETVRRRNKLMVPEAQNLYERAAKQGSIYAMMRLADNKDELCLFLGECSADRKTPEEWGKIARSLAEERAAQGEGEALYQLFLMTAKLNWLIKSAEAGFGVAQDRLGTIYREGGGGFFIPGKRQKEVERWLKTSAESGYAVGMSNYSDLLERRGDMKGAGYWTRKAAEAGHFGSMSSYAGWTAHMPDKAGYPLDLVKAYGLTLLMAEAEPGIPHLGPSYGEEALVEVAAKMTAEQVEAGKVYAREWEKAHPPLSRFPYKYGY